jgi:hypothetical protein
MVVDIQIKWGSRNDEPERHMKKKNQGSGKGGIRRKPILSRYIALSCFPF